MEEEYEEMKLMTREEYIFFNDNNYLSDNINNITNKTGNKNENKKRIYISPDHIKYELVLEKDENDQIIITINENNSNSFIKYQAILIIGNLINLSPYFKLLYSINTIFAIDSIYTVIKTKLDNNIITQNYNILNMNNNESFNIINLQKSNVYISHLNDLENKIYFIFNIVYCNLKTEEIKLELEYIEKVDDEDSLKLIQILFKNKYNYIERINFLKKKLRKAQKSSKKYENLLDKCNAYFGQNMKIKMSFLDRGIDTDIFLSKEEYIFVIKAISKTLKKNISKLNQIYKASCNGDNINAFHQNCQNIPNTLILIITDEKKRFGGFTQAEWDNSNKNKFDDKAFLFSLDNFEIYPILDEYKNKAINCREDFYAPIFGEDLFLFDGFFSSQLNKTKEKYYNYSKSKLNEEYKLSGQEYFTVTEMEVYQVIFS